MSATRRTVLGGTFLWCARHLLPAFGLLLVAFAIFSAAVPERRPMRRMATPEVPLPARLLPAPATAKALPDYPVIVLDPGHGGADDGASANGLREKDLTLDLSRRVATRLQELGYPVVITRAEDVYVALSDRVAIANACPGSLLVSLHFNQSADASIHGVETFYASAKVAPSARWPWLNVLASYFAPARQKAVDEAGEKLAACLQRALSTRLLDTDRGIRPRDLYVVQHARQPAVLVEAAFLSNANQALLLRTEEYRERIASGIVNGIAAYVGAPKRETMQMVRK